MDKKRYWFPVRPASSGWGWGLPLVWEGWAVLVGFFALLIGGMTVLAPYGQFAAVGYACVLAGCLLAVAFWKGEPQARRHDRVQ